MEKTIKINIPDGYDDVKFNEKTNEIEFIKKDNKSKKPRSWEEYCENVKYTPCYISRLDDPDGLVEEDNRKEIPHVCEFNTKEEAVAFIALGKLIQLRDSWIGDWRPDWNGPVVPKYGICNEYNDIGLDQLYCCNKILIFPSKEMRDDFVETFRDLIEEAKTLI